ncbi:MAG: RnfABCDGE type electron transport complex subunit B [Candidatus Omnitrophota bacterium]|jgi:electron transport complex protein RnfB
MEILYPIIALGSLGILFGVGLSLAAKKFCVSSDPRIDKIQNNLPGANCGACGMGGCSSLAEALTEGKCGIDKCTVVNEDNKIKISQILGIEFKKSARKIATLHCGAGVRVKNRYVYSGIEDCVAANLVLGGQKSCIYGCLGFGTCARVCPFGAIEISEEGLPVIDKDKCRGCNKCVEACPKKLFSLTLETHNVSVACSSKDVGKDTKSICPVGCIACGLCEKACKFDAIHVVDNVAVIDYNKCTSCGECVKVCPMKTIKS